MNRKEEREAVAKNKYPYIKGFPQTSSHQSIFVEAAEWADETMIEKACRWLENVNTDDYMDSGVFQIHDMIRNFKKAMTM